ncbi:hypothetical protein EV356DRAFT_506123 [Viridothelium virens]|uniref:Fatty acid hydroxylase domain-containing protein n=1 Tax=Viridothelium virens TaxID=1048519 RepID=A0A6A6HLP9_VIRVR|nr:hypothetical protein EV356DRAFT_506123 [Viridothelium virens]
MGVQSTINSSMKSTWRRTDRTSWTSYQKLVNSLGIYHVSLNKRIPIHQKDDPMPNLPDWRVHCWILIHALIPIAIQQIYCSLFNRNLHPIAAFFLYSMAFKCNGIREIQILRQLGHRYGFLDGDKHFRDEVPDDCVAKVLYSLFSTATFRCMIGVMLSYRRSQLPSSLSLPWLVVEIGAYSIVLDFWFYWYHRCMHEVDGLWKYHRTHHLTKHPNPLLTLYADYEQEIFDIAGVPLMTYGTLKLMGFPMGFYEWWICQQYVVFTELFGHSGLRIYATPPSTVTWLLRLFDAELQTEDHDLHHRKGWRKSHNYGKQTLVWDRLFNTCHPRIEATKENADYDNPAIMPLF